MGGLVFFMQGVPVEAAVKAAEAPYTAAEIVLEVNRMRAREGTLALNISPLLEVAAGLKGEHMAKGLYFAHNTPEGYTPWHFFALAGYSYSYGGENLAIGFFKAKKVVEAMMESPKHRDNILGVQYKEVAVAVVPTFYGKHLSYMVIMLFGTKR